MHELCDLKIHVNGLHTFLLHEKTLCSFSGAMKKIVKRGGRRRRSGALLGLKIMEFPGGPEGFELVSRFCYSRGGIAMSPANVCILHCAAIFLEMTEEVSAGNLLRRTEIFLDGLFYWTWDDVLTAVKSCETALSTADSSGLLPKLISSLLSKISANSEATTTLTSCSSSSSHEASAKSYFGREWWFDDLAILSPAIVERVMRILGAHGDGNRNLTVTRFLLYYLKPAAQKWSLAQHRKEFRDLADTAVHGVVLMGRRGFSCRGLFRVLRVVSGLGISRESRRRLERLMGTMLDHATLDDLLVSAGHHGGVYDVDLVVRLVSIFVGAPEDDNGGVRMKKVGRLIDKYLQEISPDQSLEVSKFLAVAECLPDVARDCFDGVYRALDIYLESHPRLSIEEQTRLCRCLNFQKLTLEASKDLAKNRRIPPAVAVQALASQQSKLQNREQKARRAPCAAMAAEPKARRDSPPPPRSVGEEALRMSLQRMQNRLVELERMCRDMKGQMSRMVKGSGSGSGSGWEMPRLC